jgi:hypothetical protein
MNPQSTHPGRALEQASEAPGPRRAHFCQGGIKGGGANIGSGVTAAIIPTAILGGIALAVAGFFALARYPWLPLAVRATVMAIIFLVLMIALFRVAARGYRRTMSSLKLPMEMDPGADLNVICWPDQKQRLEAYLPPPSDPGYFEPEACRVWVARRTSHAARMQDPKVAKRFFAAIILFPFVLQALVQGAVHNVIDRTALVVVCIGVALTLSGFVLYGFLFPKFLRVAPGRVDIVRFGFLGRTPTIETIDLRDRPVRLDLKRKELLIGGWHASHPDAETEAETDAAHADKPEDSKPGTIKDPASTKPSKFAEMYMSNQAAKDSQASLGSAAQIKALTIIPLWATTDGRTLEDAAFRAAVSSADPGPLPDDRLIG